ncbi:TrmH family RNA methyltransferase [Sphingorhabdus sp.]|jgi:TrmH family RNA methyltransferase|uniref:TrmH family RNA methyltransferase n=3 Tax=Sphingorhabdus sp. TaxID=1902408 RepID=UPI003BAFEB69|nr:RNA methyltransferase [Sphingomonadales bacterium]MBK9433540.1 RNA methyltransferase [Sphingomonadales bacterium]MBL0021763.1 RNA methyltransferase [Sphingomonadales bacterium]
MRREITGFSNPLVKQVRSLREKKHRKREGLFLAEGLRIMTEAREAGFLPEMLFRCADRDAHSLEIVLEGEVLTAGGDVIETSADILSKLSGKDNAQTVIGVYHEHPTALSDIDRNAAPIWLVAQAMRDPGNLGTMLRTGDAVGAGGLILIDDCTDPFSVEAVRASMGAIFTQKIVQCRWAEFVEWLRGGPGQLVGTSLQTELDYQDPSYQSPCFILTGNEAQGMPADYAAECDLLVKMPMRGKADSLNAAVATAVMAYEVLNQFRRT